MSNLELFVSKKDSRTLTLKGFSEIETQQLLIIFEKTTNYLKLDSKKTFEYSGTSFKYVLTDGSSLNEDNPFLEGVSLQSYLGWQEVEKKIKENQLKHFKDIKEIICE